MIYTVFCTSSHDDAAGDVDGQVGRLARSWHRVRQPGELVRLVAQDPSRPLPSSPHARVVTTMSWSPHPYTDDVYPPYQRAAGLLEWLFTEDVQGTILLVEPTFDFRAAMADEIRPGQAKAGAWLDRPAGAGPFGLGAAFSFLDRFCVDRQLELAAVRLPVLIHSTDLRKIVARWLELMSLIRAETARCDGARGDADEVAYVIAAAEARVPHAVADLATSRDAADGAAPADDEGDELASLRPCKRADVREGQLLGSLFLEIPGRADAISLNASGAAIWHICDGSRTIAEIRHTLEARYEMPTGTLQTDVERVIRGLERIGALRFARSL